MSKLTALRPILYLSKLYNVGSELPASDSEMVKAWIKAGSAHWNESEDSETATATPAAAQAGVEAIQSNSDSGELVGRVPKNPIKGRSNKK